VDKLVLNDLQDTIRSGKLLMSHPEFLNHAFAFESGQENAESPGREQFNRVLQWKSLIWK